MNWIPLIEEFYPVILAILGALIPVLASYHIITSKEDVRSAIGWTGLVWLVPFFGALLYLFFGVNRIQRKAVRVRRARKLPKSRRPGQLAGQPSLSTLVPDATPDMVAQAILMDRVSNLGLTKGNLIRPLEGGEAAFAEMLAAIRAAEHSIVLSTYIFDFDEAGREFADALAEAAARGVEVRILVDAVGELYHWPSVTRALKKRKLRFARFNRNPLFSRMSYVNLRNHRKILVIDGRLGFTGGMNIRQGHMELSDMRNAIRDIHFCLEGPITAQLTEIFAEDWAFAAGEGLEGPPWFPAAPANGAPGNAVARGIADGPDEDRDHVKWAIISALGMARRSVKIMTPYFLPDRILVSALNHTALKGVEVDIIVPEESNLRFVGWASEAQFGQVLEGGCRIHLSPPPFDHSKVMIVDEGWVLFGSSNWDPRSLRLNFEFNVECYDEVLAAQLVMLFARRLADTRMLAASEVRDLPIWRRTRNGIAWLFSPYL